MTETPTEAREPDLPNTRASATAPMPNKKSTARVARAQRVIDFESPPQPSDGLWRARRPTLRESSGPVARCQPQHIDTTGDFALSSLDATDPGDVASVSSQHDGIRTGRIRREWGHRPR